MNKRVNIFSSSKWESIVGYSRAVRVGEKIFVSGTVASDDNGDIVGEGDVYLQTKFILQKIEKALNLAGASINDVVRIRMFVLDISKWEDIAKAHSEVFNNIRPAASMIEINRLINEKFLIEIEADAVLLPQTDNNKTE